MLCFHYLYCTLWASTNFILKFSNVRFEKYKNKNFSVKTVAENWRLHIKNRGEFLARGMSEKLNHHRIALSDIGIIKENGKNFYDLLISRNKRHKKFSMLQKRTDICKRA